MSERKTDELVELVTGKSGRKILRLFIDDKRMEVAEEEIYKTLGHQGRNGWDVKAVLKAMCEASLLKKEVTSTTVYVINLDTLKRVGGYLSGLGKKISEFAQSQQAQQ